MILLSFRERMRHLAGGDTARLLGAVGIRKRLRVLTPACKNRNPRIAAAQKAVREIKARP